MNTSGPPRWMWTDAIVMLERMQRLREQEFAPARAVGGAPCWEPPVDVLETESEVFVLVALPGVDPDKADVLIDNGVLVVRGQRVLPPQLRGARIHRLELPQGQFERHVALPPGRYGQIGRASFNGCLLVTLSKAPRGGAR